jgi:hypothetical protein
MATRVKTEFGDIWAPTGPCRDNYQNMEVYNQLGSYQIVILQHGAMNSFKAAEKRFYKLSSAWAKAHPKQDRRPIIVLAGSKRDCATQRRLYASDPSRFAPPDVTLHTRGLAIDVDQRQPALTTVYKVLAGHGWNRSRPTDEPWHWSYHFTA